ncbi:MAG: hypothetical protein L0Z07_06815, partial [Planctomycetes bacterium]|nr:hypothetical protein [Planctomycetota bacterium]
LSRHSPGERAELSTLPTDKRLRRIEQLIAEDGRQASRQLSPEESERLRREIRTIAEQRKPQVLEQLRRRGVFEKLREQGVRNLEERIRNLDDKTALFIAVFTLMNSDAAEPTRNRLIEQLSPESRSHLEKASRSPRRIRDWQLVRWMRESLEPQRGPEALERFFSEQLDHDQRARLLSLPQHEMEDELERLYLGDQLGLPSHEWLQGFMDRGLFLRDIPGPGQPLRRGPEDPRRDRGPDGMRRPWRDNPPEGPPPHRPSGMPPPKPGDQQQPI